MEKKKQGRWFGLILGPSLSFFALVGLWKNETRFDYYRAAAATESIESVQQGQPGQTFSMTGPMDQEAVLTGDYVDSFKGYLRVDRDAEIYAWDKDKSDDRVRWDLEWMDRVESNNRNQGVSQTFSSKQFFPDRYEVGELPVERDMIEFIDSLEPIPANSLRVLRPELKLQGEYLYFSKGKSDKLGDERVSYSGIPVPEVATYFGKFQAGSGVADTSNARTGMINRMIGDTGILHHLVAGDRDVALASIKTYFSRLKWMVRLGGTVVVVLGCYIFLATIFGFLFHVPVIGRLVGAGAFVASLVVGLPIAIATIGSAYLIAHPFVLVGLLGTIGFVIYWLNRGGRASQAAIRQDQEVRYGHVLSQTEVKELEFIELAQLAMSDSGFGQTEEDFLREWAKKHQWNDQKFQEMMVRARDVAPELETSNDEHLMNLIRLALSDGSVSNYEINSIRRVARKLGYDDGTIRELMTKVRDSALTDHPNSGGWTAS